MVKMDKDNLGTVYVAIKEYYDTFKQQDSEVSTILQDILNTVMCEFTFFSRIYDDYMNFYFETEEDRTKAKKYLTDVFDYSESNLIEKILNPEKVDESLRDDDNIPWCYNNLQDLKEDIPNYDALKFCLQVPKLDPRGTDLTERIPVISHYKTFTDEIQDISKRIISNLKNMPSIFGESQLKQEDLKEIEQSPRVQIDSNVNNINIKTPGNKQVQRIPITEEINTNMNNTVYNDFNHVNLITNEENINTINEDLGASNFADFKNNKLESDNINNSFSNDNLFKSEENINTNSKKSVYEEINTDINTNKQVEHNSINIDDFEIIENTYSNLIVDDDDEGIEKQTNSEDIERFNVQYYEDRINNLDKGSILSIYEDLVTLINTTDTYNETTVHYMFEALIKELFEGLQFESVKVHKNKLGFLVANIILIESNRIGEDNKRTWEIQKAQRTLKTYLNLPNTKFYSFYKLNEPETFKYIITEIHEGFEDNDIITFFKVLRNYMYDRKNNDIFINCFILLLHDIFDDMVTNIDITGKGYIIYCQFENDFERHFTIDTLCKYFGFTLGEDLQLTNKDSMDIFQKTIEIRLFLRGFTEYRELDL